MHVGLVFLKMSSGWSIILFLFCAEESIIFVDGVVIMTAKFMDIQLPDLRAYEFQWVE